MAAVVSSTLIVGMEIHVELATRTKMFSRAPSPVLAGAESPPPNTCIDPVVLGLPGALPVINRHAVELAMTVGLALGCRIAEVTKWDRKSYFYPDLPKGYQISQYDLPLCFDGAIDLPAPAAKQVPGSAHIAVDDDAPTRRIGIIRAHLEEDAGKLLHEAPGGGGGGGAALDGSIVDFNRAGTPLLEIVTQPDFRSADEAVLFAFTLRNLIRFLGASPGILEKGHIRFEPNINCRLTLDNGRTISTPIVEVKNLNSFKSLRGAIEFEAREQPLRWAADQREHGPGAKQTRGWDDARQCTTLQRDKEDAHDYRYFPDPDLLPLTIDDAWRSRIAAAVPELPAARARRYRGEFGLTPKESAAIIAERPQCDFFESAVNAAETLGVPRTRGGKAVANILLQSGARRANERTPAVLYSDLGITPLHVAQIVAIREAGAIGSNAADELFGLLCDPANATQTAETLAMSRGMLTVRDDIALDQWCQAAIAANAQAAADVSAGKDAAIGRLVGAVMKLSAGRADAAAARQRLIALLRA